MKVSRKSWHYRLMNWLETPYNKESVSLCSYVWWLFFSLVLVIVFIILSPILGIAFGLVWSVEKIKESQWWQNRKKAKMEGAAKSNIFVEYVRAKKRKICPLIEFTDD